MKEDDFITSVRDEVATALPGKYTVRTAGGDETSSPPVCILTYGTDSRNENGHTPYAGTVTDSSGDAIGEELHKYYTVTVDVNLKSYSERERDELKHSIREQFLPFERDSSYFNDDTFEWEVGGGSPGNQSQYERDWYTLGLTLRCGLLTRVQDTDNADTLTGVEETYDIS